MRACREGDRPGPVRHLVVRCSSGPRRDLDGRQSRELAYDRRSSSGPVKQRGSGSDGLNVTQEMEMGQWVMGHGSNGSPFLDGSRGSWVTASDPLTHDDEITAQYSLQYFVLS